MKLQEKNYGKNWCIIFCLATKKTKYSLNEMQKKIKDETFFFQGMNGIGSNIETYRSKTKKGILA